MLDNAINKKRRDLALAASKVHEWLLLFEKKTQNFAKW